MSLNAAKNLLMIWAVPAAILAGCNVSNNGELVAQIIAEGDYCTQHTQNTCRIGGYIVLKPGQKSLADIAATRSFDEFIPAQSCVGNRFLLGDIAGKLYSFCELDTLPSSYSLDEKFKFIKSEIGN